MKRDLLTIVFSVLVILMVSIQGFNEGRIAEKQAKIEGLKKGTTELEIQVVELKEKLRPKLYCLPLEQLWISSGTGYRVDPMGGATESLHKGVDLVGRIEAPIKAALAGEVVEHWPAPDGYWRGHPIFGGLVVLDHGEELFTRYGHLSVTFVHEGDWVEMGQIIGELGNTGVSTGPHLHFEVVVDPLRYLEGR